jgi:hypothetical protein
MQLVAALVPARLEALTRRQIQGAEAAARVPSDNRAAVAEAAGSSSSQYRRRKRLRVLHPQGAFVRRVPARHQARCALRGVPAQAGVRPRFYVPPARSHQHSGLQVVLHALAPLEIRVCPDPRRVRESRVHWATTAWAVVLQQLPARWDATVRQLACRWRRAPVPVPARLDHTAPLLLWQRTVLRAQLATFALVLWLPLATDHPEETAASSVARMQSGYFSSRGS